MKTQLLSLSEQDRRLAFDNAAVGLQLSPVILEKDFWVSWLLGLLFSQPEWAGQLVFKGGTSLSKVFGVIDRFSEDIDLSLQPAFVGADVAAFDALNSRIKRDAAMNEMQALCADKVQQLVMPTLEAVIGQDLGAALNGTWLRFVLDAEAKSPVVFFAYPTTQTVGFEYVRPEVKLEFGTLTDQQPTDVHPVRPLVAKSYEALFADWQCDVVALSLERTFWEKATILHAEFHRPEGSVMPDRYARHYFDMVKLLQHPNAQQMLTNVAQCQRVVDWKSKVFARAWARYDLAQPGTFRLVPPPSRQAALAQDYTRMQPMFMSQPPSFADLLAQLASAENQLNN
jgi:Nucleotidyl transferase AbiEii toxin, Type IV TA system